MKVDKALILTNVDGLYEGNPHSDNGDMEPRLITRVEKIDDHIKAAASDGKSDLGLGGMRSKVLAAEMITAAGIETIIANGNYSIIDILKKRYLQQPFPCYIRKHIINIPGRSILPCREDRDEEQYYCLILFLLIPFTVSAEVRPKNPFQCL